MSKIKGRGGIITKGGVVQARVKSFSFSEQHMGMQGQTGCTVELETFADSSATPYRIDDTFTLVLSHDVAAWTIDCGTVKVRSADIRFSGGDAVSQSISVEGYTTPVIA